MAALEGGVGAIATASGQAALHLAIATLAGAGSHIVGQQRAVRRLAQPAALHAGALRHRAPPSSSRATSTAGARAIRPNTKLLFGETLGNPGLDVLDIPTVSAIAHDAGVPLLVDSTFTTPWLMRPFDHGADLVFHSATKFLSRPRHGGRRRAGRRRAASTGARLGRFPELNQPYAGFHGMVFSEESTDGAFLLRARREGLRDFGACMSPHTAWLILQGIETLPLRMARHVENTRKVVAVPGRAADGRARRLPGTRGPPQPCAGQGAAATRLRARSSASTSRARARRARPSSRR